MDVKRLPYNFSIFPTLDVYNYFYDASKYIYVFRFPFLNHYLWMVSQLASQSAWLFQMLILYHLYERSIKEVNHFVKITNDLMLYEYLGYKLLFLIWHLSLQTLPTDLGQLLNVHNERFSHIHLNHWYFWLSLLPVSKRVNYFELIVTSSNILTFLPLKF